MNGFYVIHGKNYSGKHGGYIGGCCWKEEKEVLHFLQFVAFDERSSYH